MRPKSTLICLMLGCMLLAVVPGCHVVTPPPPPEPVTLRVAALYGSGRASTYFAPLVASFNERYPHITVEIAAPIPQYPETDCGYNLANCVLPQAVDVFAFEASLGHDLWRRDLLLDLSDFDTENAQHEAADFLPGVLDAFTVAGRQIAIPMGLRFTALFYNQDLFDRARVAYPTPEWMWTDFLAAAQAFTDRERGVFGYAPSDWYFWLYNNGGAIFDYSTYPPHPTFNDPRVVEILERYIALRDVYRVMPTDEEVQEHILRSSDRHAIIEWGIHNQKFAFWEGVALGVKTRRAQHSLWPERVAVVPMPRNGVRVTRVLLWGQGVSATTAHPEAAWQWVTFTAQQPPLHTESLLPVRRSVLTAPAYIAAQGRDVVETTLAVMSGATDFGLCGEHCDVMSQMAPVAKLFYEAAQTVLEGERSAVDALTEAQHEAEKLLYRGIPEPVPR